jgi:hypothetical protein
MIRRGYNMRDAILHPATHAERLVVAETIVREVLAEHGTPGRVIDDELVKRVATVTLAAVEMSIEKAKS